MRISNTGNNIYQGAEVSDSPVCSSGALEHMEGRYRKKSRRVRGSGTLDHGGSFLQCPRIGG